MRNPLAVLDHLFDGGNAFADRHHDVDQPHFLELAGGVEVALQHDLLGQARADALAQEGVGAHAGEQVEQHLRQAHQHAFLGDDGVATQRSFEAAAQCIALDQGDAVRTCAEPGMEGVHAAYAALGIVEQAGAVAFADQPAEQLEVTTQVEHVTVRGQDDMG